MASDRLRRVTALAYGLVAYGFGLAVLVYGIGFIANAVVPKSIDSGSTHGFGPPIVVNLVLLGVFGLQHSVMARPEFKERWTRIVLEPVERSTYVVFSGLALGLVFWGWQPMNGSVWELSGLLEPVLWAVYLGGWLLVVAASEMIDARDLFGLRQVLAYYREEELDPLGFQTPAAYRYIRHPIMAGFLVAFWVTPEMTVGHLLFAATMTAYILVGVRLEERDLVSTIGETYERYQEAVPRFVPWPGRSFSASSGEGEEG